jgi:hypothetical protein
MIMCLNYLQGVEEMISEFKFFWGISKGTGRMRVVWGPDLIERRVDVEEDLTRVMSEEIARSIDEEIISTITRRINGGYSNLQERVEYFERWLDMGGNRA